MVKRNLRHMKNVKMLLLYCRSFKIDHACFAKGKRPSLTTKERKNGKDRDRKDDPRNGRCYGIQVSPIGGKGCDHQRCGLHCLCAQGR
jgi:hypothetical protein